MNKIISFFKANIDEIIKPVVVLLAICIVIPLALAVTNAVTSERIAELEAKNETATMKQLIKAENFPKATYKGEEEFDYYIAKQGGERVGYIFITSAKGYGGAVSVMTAVNNDGTVKSVAILDASNETPGLGQNVTKEAFYSQFDGKKNGVKVVKNGAISENNEINAVTGATISSTAVTKAVNEAQQRFEKISKTEVAVNE